MSDPTSEKAPPRKAPIEPEIVQSVPLGMEMSQDPSLPLVLRNRLLNDALIRDPMEHFEHQLALLSKLRPAAIKQTKPHDWIAMGPEKVYLVSSGAERFTSLFGLVFGAKHIWTENHEGGTFSIICTMPVFSTVTRVYYDSIDGGRWSGEKFFDKFDDQEPPNKLPVNPLDVRKAAITNCEIRAVSKIAGLRGLVVADLQKIAGFVPSSKVDFKSGGKGGTSAARQGLYDSAGKTQISWGKQQGTLLTELSEEDLEWHTKNASAQLKKPENMEGGKWFKYRAEKEEAHRNLLAEVHRRLDDEEGPERDEAPPEEEGGR